MFFFNGVGFESDSYNRFDRKVLVGKFYDVFEYICMSFVIIGISLKKNMFIVYSVHSKSNINNNIWIDIYSIIVLILLRRNAKTYRGCLRCI